MLGVGRARAYELVAQGRLPNVRAEGRTIQIPAAAMRAYLAALAEEAIDNLSPAGEDTGSEDLHSEDAP